jgi:hypothetical protein
MIHFFLYGYYPTFTLLCVETISYPKLGLVMAEARRWYFDTNVDCESKLGYPINILLCRRSQEFADLMTYILIHHNFCFFFVLFFFVFCTMTNKCTIIPQIITLLHVSTLSCHPQTACNQYLAKLHKNFKCSSW